MAPSPQTARVESKAVLSLRLFVIGFTALMLASLIWGLFDPFFFGSNGRSEQGVDFFSTPKAFLNLLDGRSMYDSWGGTPFAPAGRTTTWYLMHPAFTVLMASWLAVFRPWTSYWVFTCFALGALWASARTLASLTDDRIEKEMAYVFLFCSFVTYWLLYVGNMHSVIVLSLALILAGMYELSYGRHGTESSRAVGKVAAGLMISLLSKPVLLLAFPVFLVNRVTRRASLKVLVVYAIVTGAFLFVPFLNPESIGLKRLTELALHPALAKQNLDVYANNFVLNADMKDNSIHWLNIVAQSGAYRNHVDIFSLSALVNSGLGRALPGAVYQMPVLTVLLCSGGLLLIRDERERLRVSLLIVMASNFGYFLSYNTVWEYQYTLLLPCVGILFLLFRHRQINRRIGSAILALCLFYYVPSPYFLISRAPIDVTTMNLIRSTKVVPTAICFTLIGWIILQRELTESSGRTAG